MYEFILNMWVTRRVDEAKVYSYVTKNFITEADAEFILATPQI